MLLDWHFIINQTLKEQGQCKLSVPLKPWKNGSFFEAVHFHLLCNNLQDLFYTVMPLKVLHFFKRTKKSWKLPTKHTIVVQLQLRVLTISYLTPHLPRNNITLKHEVLKLKAVEGIWWEVWVGVRTDYQPRTPPLEVTSVIQTFAETFVCLSFLKGN